MKTFRFILLVFFSSVLFSGCFLKSVHPLVAPENAVLIDGLEGIWESEDQRWTFMNDITKFPDVMKALDADPAEEEDIDEEYENSYFILFEQLQDLEADTALFMGRAIELNGNYFLDLYVFAKDIKNVEISDNENFVENHYIKVHTFSKLTVEESELKIELFASSFIKEQISARRIRIKHENTDDGVLITASTKELQKFVSKYGDDEDAFEDGFTLKYRGYSIED